MASFTKFSGYESPLAPLRRSHFVGTDGNKYHSVEQYYWYQKALHFNEKEVARTIINSSSPTSARFIGLSKLNYNENVDWPAEEVMKEGCLAKFEQNTPLRKYLLKTGNTTLVNCHPEDTFFGIGLFRFDRLTNHPVTWKGSNKLGKLLMDIREQMSKYQTEMDKNEIEEIEKKLKRKRKRIQMESE